MREVRSGDSNNVSDFCESGFVMVTMLIVMVIISGLVVVMLTTQSHTNNATARNRSWGAAVHVAESGVHEAIAYLQSTNGVAPIGTQSGSTAEGTWQYVVTPRARKQYQIDAIGTVGTNSSLASSRRLRVILAPPTSFRYALMSLSDVSTKNNNIVCGDLWANSYVTVYQNNSVLAGSSSGCPSGAVGNGNITAAMGSVTLQVGSHVDGSIWTGGYDSAGKSVLVANQAVVKGGVKASSSAPSCSDDLSHLHYAISNDGTISGSVTTWGAITGSGSSGTRNPLTCSAAAASAQMPTFSWNAANYPTASTHSYTFPADYSLFNSYIAANRTALQGTFYITGGSSSTPVDLTGVSIAGDTTIVATGSPINADGIGSANSADKVLVLVSYYSAPASACTTTGGNPGDCAIGLKNDFDMSSTSLGGGSNTAILLFAPNGPVALKNSAQFNGAIYANNIQVKNNMSLAYDPRIDQIVGFGEVTLHVKTWMECTPAPVSTSSC